jgi:hypothetical protein
LNKWYGGREGGRGCLPFGRVEVRLVVGNEGRVMKGEVGEGKG